MFGASPPPQSETTPFYPRSPRGRKVRGPLDGDQLPRGLRDARLKQDPVQPRVTEAGRDLVTSKITRVIARIREGLQDRLYLGNLDAERDWGFAPDNVRAMELMLAQDQPGD